MSFNNFPESHDKSESKRVSVRAKASVMLAALAVGSGYAAAKQIEANREAEPNRIELTQNGDPTNLDPTPNGTIVPEGLSAPSDVAPNPQNPNAPINPDHIPGSATEGTSRGAEQPMPVPSVDDQISQGNPGRP